MAHPQPPTAPDAPAASRIVQVNCSGGGVPKRAVREAQLGTNGFTSDDVNHPKIHGGPERAVCLFPLEHLLALQAEGHPVFPGALGENLTTWGLDWRALRPGVVLRLGEAAVIQVTRAVPPCSTIAPYFKGGDFRRVDAERNPGWSRFYARVLMPGLVRTGSEIAVLDAESVPPAEASA